jgi:hypothetical protein
LLLQRKLRHQPLKLAVLPLQIFEELDLIQLQSAELFSPTVVSQRRDLGISTGLWGSLSVGDFQFNLPQRRYDLLRLVFLHRHTSFPPE